MHEETILSCDWGTSSVRLRRVDAASGRITGETAAELGVKKVYETWRTSNEDRQAHFMRALAPLLEALGRSPSDRALIVSGMAGSSIGIADLPYAEVPFRLDGADLSHRVIGPSSGSTGRTKPAGSVPSRKGTSGPAAAGTVSEGRGRREGEPEMPVLLLSGVRSADDVMRGEECELIGLRHVLDALSASALVILPGTHSKHARIEAGALVGFRTYMTGELFDVLTTASILAASVARGPFDAAAFERGVRTAARHALSNALFAVRTNDLFGRFEPTQNYWFLSGLLVGSELREIAEGPEDAVYVCETSQLGPAYRHALDVLDVERRIEVISRAVADRSAADGHLVAYRRIFDHGGT